MKKWSFALIALSVLCTACDDDSDKTTTTPIFYEMTKSDADSSLPQECRDVDASTSAFSIKTGSDLEALKSLLTCRKKFEPNVSCDNASFQTMCQASNLAISCVNGKTRLMKCSSCSAGQCRDAEQLDAALTRTLAITLDADINLNDYYETTSRTILMPDQTFSKQCTSKFGVGLGSMYNVDFQGNGHKISFTDPNTNNACYLRSTLFSVIRNSTVSYLALDFNTYNARAPFAVRLDSTVLNSVYQKGTIVDLNTTYDAGALAASAYNATFDGCVCSGDVHYTPNAKSFDCPVGLSEDQSMYDIISDDEDETEGDKIDKDTEQNADFIACKDVNTSIESISIDSAKDFEKVRKLLRCRVNYSVDTNCNSKSETNCMSDKLAVSCIENKRHYQSCSSCKDGVCADAVQVDDDKITLTVELNTDLNLADLDEVVESYVVLPDKSIAQRCTSKRSVNSTLGSINNTEFKGNGHTITFTHNDKRCVSRMPFFSTIRFSKLSDLHVDMDIYDAPSGVGSSATSSALSDLTFTGSVVDIDSTGWAGGIVTRLTKSTCENCSCGTLANYTPNAKSFSCLPN